VGDLPGESEQNADLQNLQSEIQGGTKAESLSNALSQISYRSSSHCFRPRFCYALLNSFYLNLEIIPTAPISHYPNLSCVLRNLDCLCCYDVKPLLPGLKDQLALSGEASDEYRQVADRLEQTLREQTTANSLTVETLEKKIQQLEEGMFRHSFSWAISTAVTQFLHGAGNILCSCIACELASTHHHLLTIAGVH